MRVTVDEGMLRRMANDAAVYSLTRPWAIVMWLALAGALILSFVNLSVTGSEDGLLRWMPFASIGLMIYVVFLTVSGARRAVRAASPPGTVVWARVDDHALYVGSGRRTSEIPFREFQSLSAGRNAVLFKIRDASVITAVPRELLSDADIALLRERIG